MLTSSISLPSAPANLLVHKNGTWASLPAQGKISVQDNVFDVRDLDGSEFETEVSFPGDVEVKGDLTAGKIEAASIVNSSVPPVIFVKTKPLTLLGLSRFTFELQSNLGPAGYYHLELDGKVNATEGDTIVVNKPGLYMLNGFVPTLAAGVTLTVGSDSFTLIATATSVPFCYNFIVPDSSGFEVYMAAGVAVALPNTFRWSVTRLN